MNHTNMNKGKVHYIEDKVDFKEGNATGHSTIQAPD